MTCVKKVEEGKVWERMLLRHLHSFLFVDDAANTGVQDALSLFK